MSTPVLTPPSVTHLPYAGTSGHSGSDTSRERAERDDGDGTTRDRQQRTLRAIGARTVDGMTWKELGAAYGWHHGKASGVLSVLHKEGALARLQERRDRCAVYVLPQYVNGRETAAQGRHDPVAEALLEWLSRGPDGWSRAGRDPVGFAKAMREITGIGAT